MSASAAPVSGPTRRPTWPTSIFGSQCRAKTWLDAVELAGGDHVERTAGHHLLGGLEHQPDPARERAARGAPRRAPAGADQRPRCATSWPQAWPTPSTVRAPGHASAVVDRQRVDVGAQGDHRAVGLAADLGDQPALRQQLDLDRRPSRARSATSAGRAVLLPASSGCAWRSRRSSTSSASCARRRRDRGGRRAGRRSSMPPALRLRGPSCQRLVAACAARQSVRTRPAGRRRPTPRAARCRPRRRWRGPRSASFIGNSTLSSPLAASAARRGACRPRPGRARRAAARAARPAAPRSPGRRAAARTGPPRRRGTG